MLSDDEKVSIAGAVAPDREYRVDAGGVGIAVHEWGDEGAPPLFLAHGGFDFGRTFDVFAPKLAGAGWRVVSWDQRGHGDSDHTELYSWDADIHDAAEVFDAVTSEPAPVIGHSKGGGLMMQLADAAPQRFSHLVNLDGITFRRAVPDVAEHERTRMLASDLESWLDHRRRTIGAQRKPGSIDDLARRRQRMNPRLPIEWLRYLVTVGARHDPDGWRWKLDPSIRFGGFGPWRPEWSMMRLPDIGVPVLAILGAAPDPMGWGTPVSDVLSHMPPGGHLEVLDDVGHFVHIEQPRVVADLVLEHLG